MLGIFLIYFIGRAFYDLAFNFDKNQWGFAIAGVASYYIGTFLGGMIIATIMILSSQDALDNTSEMALGFMALPFGILSCWGFYTILKKRWENRIVIDTDSNILDQDFAD